MPSSASPILRKIGESPDSTENEDEIGAFPPNTETTVHGSRRETTLLDSPSPVSSKSNTDIEYSSSQPRSGAPKTRATPSATVDDGESDDSSSDEDLTYPPWDPRFKKKSSKVRKVSSEAAAAPEAGVFKPAIPETVVSKAAPPEAIVPKASVPQETIPKPFVSEAIVTKQPSEVPPINKTKNVSPVPEPAVTKINESAPIDIEKRPYPPISNEKPMEPETPDDKKLPESPVDTDDEKYSTLYTDDEEPSYGGPSAIADTYAQNIPVIETLPNAASSEAPRPPSNNDIEFNLNPSKAESSPIPPVSGEQSSINQDDVAYESSSPSNQSYPSSPASNPDPSSLLKSMGDKRKSSTFTYLLFT